MPFLICLIFVVTQRPLHCFCFYVKHLLTTQNIQKGSIDWLIDWCLTPLAVLECYFVVIQFFICGGRGSAKRKQPTSGRKTYNKGQKGLESSATATCEIRTHNSSVDRLVIQ